MKNTEILIIGAGAAGLMAAHTLSKAGKKVIILETRDRIGGRVHTIEGKPFSCPVELGAEFVHGNLPVTLQLLREAGIEHTPAQGEMWHYRQGKLTKEHQFTEDWDVLMKKLNKLEEDISIGAFLRQEFARDQYTDLRQSVTKFVSGYDTAEISRASSFALRNEWQAEGDDAQYRVEGGYGKMIQYLAAESRKNGAELFLSSVVRDINWDGKQVKVALFDGTVYQARKAVIALPLGVLQPGGLVNIQPAIPEYQDALNQIGFGAIVKLLLEFKHAFWESEDEKRDKMAFVLSDEEIPTWWTQYPDRSTVLTGWLGGPPAERKKHLSNEEFLQQGIISLVNIFKIAETELRNNLVGWEIVNWTTDPFTLGSYAYDMVDSHKARKILTEPIKNTVYFSGEYLYEGPAMGTVEAALTSGLEVAKKLIEFQFQMD